MQASNSRAVGIENGAGRCLISWMRKLVLSALLLASVSGPVLAQMSDDATGLYFVKSNGEVEVTGTIIQNGQLGSVTIPSTIDGLPVTKIGNGGNSWRWSGLTSLILPSTVTRIVGLDFNDCPRLSTIVIPESVTYIADNAFRGSPLMSVTIPARFVGCLNDIGIRGTAASFAIINALANSDAFVTAVADKIKATGGNYGLATQSGLSSAIEPLATKSELTSLATKSEITTAINEGKASGIASVTASPNTWSLFTTSQIQNMAVGDLVLNRQENGSFVLNYDIEQSTDLQTWTPYEALSLPLTRLPADKAFVRIKVLNSTPNPPYSPPTDPSATPVGSNL